MAGEAAEGGGHSHGGGDPETDDHGAEPEPSKSSSTAEPSTAGEATTSAEPEHADDGHAH
ncbi:hypothetical protein V1460_21835 [Streptomyces sp. SCSIO 30461]|uniref:hypothetical protein n=1 Tax=Streptomyces sp. SCSIO 30461 TaxID=3118085 RepID=UPI0030D61437